MFSHLDKILGETCAIASGASKTAVIADIDEIAYIHLLYQHEIDATLWDGKFINKTSNRHF